MIDESIHLNFEFRPYQPKLSERLYQAAHDLHVAFLKFSLQLDIGPSRKPPEKSLIHCPQHLVRRKPLPSLTCSADCVSCCCPSSRLSGYIQTRNCHRTLTCKPSPVLLPICRLGDMLRGVRAFRKPMGWSESNVTPGITEDIQRSGTRRPSQRCQSN